MPERTKKTPYKSDVASTSKRVQLSLKQNTDKKQTYGWPNERHVGGPQWQDTSPGSETEFRKRKLNQISRECLPDEVLHGSGLEFRRGTLGREGGRKGGVRERQDAHGQ
jgi:hypothetical protein